MVINNRLVVSVLMFLFSFSSIALAQSKDEDISFDSEVIDYGKINKGDDGARFFKVSNLSNKPLLILNAESSCGCTVPEYPKEPILKGQSAKIKVVYDTQRIGPFTKTVKLYTNTQKKVYSLVIKGEVMDKN